jgi:ABC-2 type transport system permease protein
VNATLIRLAALVKKELQAILGDKQSLRLLIMPVIMQLLLFPFAATLEVKNNKLAVLDEDGGAMTAEIVQRLTQTPAFSTIVRVKSEEEARALIDRQDALLVLRFGPRFSKSAERGAPEPIQAILDGRRSNSAQIAMSYVQQVLSDVPFGPALVRPQESIRVRHWYNPNLDYFRFIVPSLVAMITTLSALIVTAMSVAREREQGTLDQLLVSPLTPSLIFLGKAVPALVVAMIQASIILAGGVFGYGIPFRGSLFLLYACMAAYVFALVGIGLFISSLCATQQQAFLGVFFFVMPAILLSGYVSPVDNMPALLEKATWANPVRHFIVITKGVYLKGAIFDDFAIHVAALLVIGVVTSGVALGVFRRRLA